MIAVPTSVGYGASFGGVVRAARHAEQLRAERRGREHRQRVRRGRARDADQPAASKACEVEAWARTLHLDPFSGIAGNMFLGALLDARALAARARRGSRRPRRAPPPRGLEGAARAARGALRAGGACPGAARRHARATTRTIRRHHGRTWREIRRLLRSAKLRAAGARPRAGDLRRARRGRGARARDPGRARPLPRGRRRRRDRRRGRRRGRARPPRRARASPPPRPRSATARSGAEHGRLPLPAPATLELLRGIPVVPAEVAWETVTPTGAAILRTVVDEFRPLPALTIEAIGHGAGDDRPGPLPERASRRARTRGGARPADRVVVLEANLDDLVPEHFDHVMERLFAAGRARRLAPAPADEEEPPRLPAARAGPARRVASRSRALSSPRPPPSACASSSRIACCSRAK